MLDVINFGFGLMRSFFITMNSFKLFNLNGVEISLFSLVIGFTALNILLGLLKRRKEND